MFFSVILDKKENKYDFIFSVPILEQIWNDLDGKTQFGDIVQKYQKNCHSAEFYYYFRTLLENNLAVFSDMSIESKSEDSDTKSTFLSLNKLYDFIDNQLENKLVAHTIKDKLSMNISFWYSDNFNSDEEFDNWDKVTDMEEINRIIAKAENLLKQEIDRDLLLESEVA